MELPEGVVTRELGNAFRCLRFLLRIGMEAQRKVPEDDVHVILVGRQDLRHGRRVALAEGTLEVRVLDYRHFGFRIAADMVSVRDGRNRAARRCRWSGRYWC